MMQLRGAARRRTGHNRAAIPRHRILHPVNSLFASLGIESWKPVITALILPPVPFLLLVLVGARAAAAAARPRLARDPGQRRAASGSRRRTGAARLARPAAARRLRRRLRSRARAARRGRRAKKPLAIVILGAGSEPFAPEYGVSSLQYRIARALALRPLARRHRPARRSPSAAAPAARRKARRAEARVAAKIAADEFGRPIPLDRGRVARHARERDADDGPPQARGDQPRRPGHARLPHAARACARFTRSGRPRRPDRGGADGAGTRISRRQRSNGCPARPAFATCASCCAKLVGQRRRRLTATAAPWRGAARSPSTTGCATGAR